MEREAPFTVMFASCFLRFPKESFWNDFGSQSFPNAPLASLAALARSLRSPHRGEFPLIVQWFSNILEILEIVSISIDLIWMFMPTWLHVGLIFRLLVHLGASRARLGASWGHLGASWGVLGRSWAVLGASWVVLGRLKGVLDASWAPLGSSWRGLGRLLTRLGGVLGRLGQVLGRLGGVLGRLGPS